MFGLRSKLSFGFGGLLIILLSVCGLGIAVLVLHRGALDRFLYENWRSVEYGQTMLNDVQRLDELEKQGDIATLSAAARPLLNEFDTNLDLEGHNLTLPGEDRLHAELSRLWRGDDAYRAAYVTLL